MLHLSEHSLRSGNPGDYLKSCPRVAVLGATTCASFPYGVLHRLEVVGYLPRLM
jgi:hypothetical protein